MCRGRRTVATRNAPHDRLTGRQDYAPRVRTSYPWREDTMRPRTTFHRPHRAPATVSLRSLPTVFGLFALLVTGGCTAESSPTFEGDEAMEPQLNRSAARCTTVRGTLVGNVFGESAVKGDLEGTTVAYKEPVVEQRGQAIHLQTFHLIRLKDGEIYTEDEGVQAPID